MKRVNQRGFSPIETTLVLVIVGLVAFIAWYVFRSSSDTNTTLGNAATTQTEVSKSGAKTDTKTTTASAIVVTKTAPPNGEYLADPNNKALYTYGSDTNGVSNCTGSCLSAWPIYKATATNDLPTDITVIKRSDGSSQYAYKGMPLYYYTSDATGAVSGNGISGFSVATP